MSGSCQGRWANRWNLGGYRDAARLPIPGSTALITYRGRRECPFVVNGKTPVGGHPHHPVQDHASASLSLPPHCYHTNTDHQIMPSSLSARHSSPRIIVSCSLVWQLGPDRGSLEEQPLFENQLFCNRCFQGSHLIPLQWGGWWGTLFLLFQLWESKTWGFFCGFLVCFLNQICMAYIRAGFWSHMDS